MIGFLVWSLAAQETPRTKEIDRWVEQLGHQDPAERERAEKSLLALAREMEHALAALDKAAKEGDPERKARAARTREALAEAVAKMARSPEAGLAEDLQRDPARHLERGRQRQQRGDLRGAIEDFERAIQLDPRMPEAWGRRGDARAAVKDLDGALEDYTRAIEIKPGFSEAWVGRGRVRAAQTEWDAAIEDFDNALRLDPGSAEAVYHRAVVWEAKGEIVTAIEDYEAALKLGDKRAEAALKRLKK